mgnify:CR=1 FL=1
MTFCLDAKIIKPVGENINNAVILLHGYGGDGNDIAALSINWKRFLPNTLFICPNGPEKCSINPTGYQWFDLNTEDEKYITEKALESEKILKKFIEEIKTKFNLHNSNICLSGFSQGCMMSINIGLTSKENFSCVVGFSGKIINKENLSKRISSHTKMLLIHGDLDTIVPASNLLDAKDFLLRNKIEVETNLIANCDHHIPIKASSIALNYIKKNFFN